MGSIDFQTMDLFFKKSPPVLFFSTGGESFEYQVLPRRERNFKIKSRTQKVSGHHL